MPNYLVDHPFRTCFQEAGSTSSWDHQLGAAEVGNMSEMSLEDLVLGDTAVLEEEDGMESIWSDLSDDCLHQSNKKAKIASEPDHDQTSVEIPALPELFYLNDHTLEMPQQATSSASSCPRPRSPSKMEK
jgi:hypothetical protein